MIDRPRPPSDQDVEQALRDLATAIDLPATPALADHIAARIAGTAPVPMGWKERLRQRTWAGAAAAMMLLVILGVALVLSPGARAAIAERLGLRGVDIELLPAAPTGTAPGAALLLGERLPLDEARRRAGFPLAVPAASEASAPDAVYLDSTPAGGAVWFVYAPSPALPESPFTGVGLLTTQFRGDLEPGLISKGLPPGTRIERVRVDGAAAYWIEGVPHVLRYRNAAGEFVELPPRLAGNTLLWTRGNVTLRMESMLARDDAIRIAESMR